MSESATRVSIDAAAYQALLHELRQYRDAELFPNTIPSLSLRKGVITARDPATYTVSVLFGAADESAFPGVAVPGVRLADTVYPFIGATCFVAFNGPDPTVLFTVGRGVGRARAWNTTNQSITNGAQVPITFNTSLGSGMHDTDTMHTSGSASVFCRWPGHFQAHGCITWDMATTVGVRRICSIQHVSASLGNNYVARTEQSYADASRFQTQEATASDFVMEAGDSVVLHGYQGGTGPLDSLTDSHHAPILELTWTGPPGVNTA